MIKHGAKGLQKRTDGAAGMVEYAIPGGDLASTRVAKPKVHAEGQTTS